MARLEYRLLDETRGFPVLYYYESIDPDEVALRFACDYFIKGQVVYEKTSCAVETGCYVIYVQSAEDEYVVDPHIEENSYPWKGIRLEVREYKEDTEFYPLVHTYEFPDENTVLLHLQSDYLYLFGREWGKTSTEIDENRKVYVYYAQPKT